MYVKTHAPSELQPITGYKIMTGKAYQSFLLVSLQVYFKPLKDFRCLGRVLSLYITLAFLVTECYVGNQ